MKLLIYISTSMSWRPTDWLAACSLDCFPHHPIRITLRDISCSPASVPSSEPVWHILQGTAACLSQHLECPESASWTLPLIGLPSSTGPPSPFPHPFPSLGLRKAQECSPRPSSLHTLYLEEQHLLYLRLQACLPFLSPAEHPPAAFWTFLLGYLTVT